MSATKLFEIRMHRQFGRLRRANSHNVPQLNFRDISQAGGLFPASELRLIRLL